MAALVNPTINPPILPPPSFTYPRSNATPSPTPSARRHDTISRDPILRNLSPTKTLRALRASSPTHHTDTELDLMKTFDNVSPSEREFGVRVAQTCKDLREWATEVEAWEWPGTFEPPPREERPAKRRRMLTEHSMSESFFDDQDHDGARHHNFWGSLPKELVEAYEVRIEEIHQAMEALDVEGLKSHVRSVHILPKSTQSKKQDEYVSFRVRSVDDFTTLITATILQALPYMSWLSRLLNEWSIRLQVLRKVPGFLAGLEDTNRHLQSAWSALEFNPYLSKDAAASVRSDLQSTQKVLGSKVSVLGLRLDSMLDELQGRSETLPDAWIDAFDNLEATFSNYVVKAEQSLTGLAWEFGLPSAQDGATSGADGLGIFTEPLRTVSADATQLHSPQPTRVLSTVASRERIESPLLGQRGWTRDESVVSQDQPTLRSRQDSAYTRFMDDVIAESLDDEQQHVPEQGRLFNAATAQPDAEEEVRPSTAPQSPPSPAKSSKSPRMRPRHVPINIAPYENEHLPISTSFKASESEGSAYNHVPPLPLSSQEQRPITSDGSVTAKKGHYTGETGHKEMLHRSHSPAKTFESASSALSRLFKSGSVHAPSRSKSNASRKTLKKRASRSRNRASISSIKTASDTPMSAVASPRSPNRDSTGTISSISAALRRVSVQETAPPHSTEQRPLTASQAMDWSDKEVVLASPAPGLYDSPFDHLRNSVQWPLMSPVPAKEPDSPDGPIRSDAFEQMFVDTLPQSPPIDDQSYSLHLMAFNNYIDQLRTFHGISDPSQDESSDQSLNHAMNAFDRTKPQRSRITELARGHKRQESDDLSLQGGYETSSAVASNISTAAIEHASSAGFHRPQMVHNRLSSRDVEAINGTSQLYAPATSNGHQRIHSKSGTDDGAPGTPKTPTMSQPYINEPTSQMARNRASDASLFSNYDTGSIILDHGTRQRSDTTRSEPAFPMPPNHKPVSHSRNRSEKDNRAIRFTLRSDSERSVIGTKLGAVKPPPLALVTSPIAEAHRSRRSTADGESNDSKPDPAAASQVSQQGTNIATAPVGDKIDQQISTVLQNMTSNIRFEPAKTAASRESKFVTSRTAPLMSNPPALRRSSIGLTLSAASPNEPSLKKHVKDGETKLYHLSQPGREQPIKLFVRLVGEEERVMVRVGGGWMDLAEYLRQYAAHHPQRTVSSKSVELTETIRVASPPAEKKTSATAYDRRRSGMIFTDNPLQDDGARTADLPVSPIDPNAVTSGFDGPVSALQTPVTPTATQTFFGLGAAPTAPSATYLESLSSPPRYGGKLDPLRSNPLLQQHRISSSAAVVGVGDRSSLSQVALREASTEPEEEEEMGDVGERRDSYVSESEVTAINGNITVPNIEAPAPRGSAALDAQKAKWVEEMIERARQSASASKVKDRAFRGSSVGDLGKVGNTKRVSMKEAVGGQ